MAQLVERTGATSVIVTTRKSHAARAKLLFEQCLPSGTEVQMLLVDEPRALGNLLDRMLYETVAFAKALAESGNCDL